MNPKVINQLIKKNLDSLEEELTPKTQICIYRLKADLLEYAITLKASLLEHATPTPRPGVVTIKVKKPTQAKNRTVVKQSANSKTNRYIKQGKVGEPFICTICGKVNERRNAYNQKNCRRVKGSTCAKLYGKLKTTKYRTIKKPTKPAEPVATTESVEEPRKSILDLFK